MKMASVISEEDVALESETTSQDATKNVCNYSPHDYFTAHEPSFGSRIHKNKKSNDIATGGSRFCVDLELHENILNSPPETK